MNNEFLIKIEHTDCQLAKELVEAHFNKKVISVSSTFQAFDASVMSAEGNFVSCFAKCTVS